ncbi:hypothetical protein IQ255_25155, partial [Pleurocapsales cyanobacterium LEGE 10410]|nr:hypothetical protein [Pleurocapsales cyanobacterium LEGE 10410]
MMLTKFRQQYPQGSLVGELVKIDRGIYIVKVSVQVNNLILATALAGATQVEAAEDAARERAIAALVLDCPQPADNSNDNSNSAAKISAINAFSSTDLATPSQQPTTGSIAPKTVDNSKIVNFSEPQSKIPAQPTISSDVKSVPSTQEFSETQLKIEPDREMVQPVANSANLFGETFTGEVIDSPDLTNSEPVANNLAQETLSVEADIPPENSEIEAMDFNEIKQKT